VGSGGSLSRQHPVIKHGAFNWRQLACYSVAYKIIEQDGEETARGRSSADPGAYRSNLSTCLEENLLMLRESGRVVRDCVCALQPPGEDRRALPSISWMT